MKDDIVLATIGSLGDLHPLIAVGQALAARGVNARLAVPQDNVDKVRAAGLEATAIIPSVDEICRDLAMTPHEVAQRVIRDQEFMMHGLVLKYLDHCIERLFDVTGNAAAIISPTLSPAGALVAEMRGIPHIPAALQPMVVLSAYEPPYYPNFPIFLQAPRLSASRVWNRFCLQMLRIYLRRKYLGQVNAARMRVQLPPSRVPPIFGYRGDEPLVLGLYSRVMGEPRPDFPGNTVLTGFPVFDADEPNRADRQATESRLQAFLAAGPAPVIFTLGSFAVHAPSNFYETSLAAARQLGLRCVLLCGENDIADEGADVFVAPYIPHSKLFPHAAVVVHHGGIGTTGQALIAGKPQIVVPHFADQFDNARRLERLGVGTTVPVSRYDVGRAAAAIESVTREQIRGRALETQAVVKNETGAETAADAILTALA